MKQAILKQSFAYAIVTGTGGLALFEGQCPIYWRREVAKRVLTRVTGDSPKRAAWHLERVTVLAVYR